ncbi:MAG TPA: carboxypeptidase regulatory-like domain-containing protein, partial [Rubricoccaceae bacterium]|nr:carboxypeptidase regulatory-like domain-containing protein [Rubricoccaceae bacterium]
MRTGKKATRPAGPSRRLGPLLGLALAALALAPGGQAQPTAGGHTVVLRGVPLAEALQRLVEATEISLVYTTELVAGKVSYCAGNGLTPEALLTCVLDGSGLDFVRSSSGAYVLIVAVEAPPPRGDLAGRVVDAATGEALPYAHVLLADASAGTTTDEAGRFAFAGLLSGPHRVAVRYVGYETADDSVSVPAGGRERVVVALRPQTLALRPLVVDGLRQRPASDTLGAGRLAGGGLSALRPSRTADLARAAAGLPGVAALQPLADLQIQGGAGGEYLTLLDGAPVRNPVSLGRHLAAFSPLALDRLTVHRAGFGPAWSHLVGVVAAEHDVAGPDGFNAAASADAVSLNVRGQGRIALPGGREAAGMVAARTSAWDVYRDPGLSDLLAGWDAPDPLLLSGMAGYPVVLEGVGFQLSTPDAAFSDLHAAGHLRLSPFRTLHVSGYRARNRLGGAFAAYRPETPFAPTHLLLTRNDYDWTNWAGQARLDGLIGARATYSAQATGGYHESRYDYRGGVELTAPLDSPDALDAAAEALYPTLAGFGSDWHHTIRELALKGTLAYSLSPRSLVEGGLAVEHTEGAVRSTGFLTAAFAHEARAWDVAAHAAGHFGLGPAVTVEPGVRLTYFPERQTVYAEPRLALRYDRAASAVGPYALRLAAGLYRQFTGEYLLSSTGATAVVPYVLFWLPPDGTLAPPRAYHLAAEAALWPSPHWTVEVQGYFKAQPRLLALDYTTLLADISTGSLPPLERAQADFLAAVEGQAYGGTARVRWRTERLSAGAAYTLSHAERQVPSRFDGRRVPVPGNAPHALALDAGV